MRDEADEALVLTGERFVGRVKIHRKDVKLKRTAEVARRSQIPAPIDQTPQTGFYERRCSPIFILGEVFDDDYSTNSYMAWLRAFGA
jgi:hypothetical protein